MLKHSLHDTTKDCIGHEDQSPYTNPYINVSLPTNKKIACEKLDFIPGFDTPLHLMKYMETDNESIDRQRRLECLKMAVQHATSEQVQTGKVYEIARDYYNYVING